MNIASTQYTLSTKSLEIYLAGCNGQPKCKGCHNPMLWDFNIGEKFTDDSFYDNIILKYYDNQDLIDNIMIFGGEPLDNNLDELAHMLFTIKQKTKASLWLFTRYELNEVNNMVLRWCDYIKCGRYEESLSTDNNIQYGIKLATSNQHIYKKGIDY